MKKPKVSFNKDAVLGFLLRNVEKILTAVIGLFACTLAWGGVDALRSMRPSGEQMPQKIIEAVKVTEEHIVSVKIPPEDRLTKERGLADVVKNRDPADRGSPRHRGCHRSSRSNGRVRDGRCSRKRRSPSGWQAAASAPPGTAAGGGHGVAPHRVVR